MKHLDLFSGIGGFALAARNVGWETVGFCEIDPYCQAVLRQHWPGVPIYDDVRTLDGRAMGSVGIVTGGYPCQPFSLAGKRGGASDDRHLWPAMCRVIETLRPAWVVGENVAGHITMGLDDVLSDLERIGYACRPFAIPAVAVDARHRRERLWIVAHANGERSGIAELAQPNMEQHLRESTQLRDWEGQAEPDVAHPNREPSELRREPRDVHSERGAVKRGGPRAKGQVVSSSGDGGTHVAHSDEEREFRLSIGAAAQYARPRVCREDVADTARDEQGRQEQRSERERARSSSESELAANANSEPSRRATESRQEHCQWLPEPDVGRVAHGIPARVDRLRALGNAIVPQVAEEIFRAIDAVN